MQDIPKIARLRTAEDPDYGFGEQRLRERMPHTSTNILAWRERTASCT